MCSTSGVAAVRQVAVRRFEIGQIDEIAVRPGRPLERDQVGEGADWSLDSVDAAGLSPRHKFTELHRCRAFEEKVETAVRGCKVNRPISRDPILWTGEPSGRVAPHWPIRAQIRWTFSPGCLQDLR
jgi:hypothetical protein